MILQQKIQDSERPFLIAGPCSVETEEQINQVVADLAQNQKVQMLRGGIWKPRTRPDSFEGVGEIGLPWLIDAGKKYNLPVTVEVANPKHAELALKAGVDVLWIGARTTVNPFAIQDIADSLAGTNIPIMIKNPVNPDLGLWIGAFERFQNAGLTDLTAIHRGFSVYSHPKYRNVPNWKIPIGLKEQMPHIPMICDPSHITGRRDLLLEVSQKALDLNFDGLMIEVHPCPDEAWSDAAQQITPDTLKDLFASLVLRATHIEDYQVLQIEDVRAKIHLLDDQLFEILVDRMKLSEELGAFKQAHNITILKEEQWKKVVSQRLASIDPTIMSQTFIRNLLDVIHQESIRHQNKIMNSKRG
jgi:chorismate mutase